MKNKKKKLTLLKSKIVALNHVELIQGGSKDTTTTVPTATTPGMECIRTSKKYVPENSQTGDLTDTSV